MADLESLIKYHRHEVDEKRRHLAKLYEQAQSMEDARQELEQTLEDETRIAHEIGTAESLSDLGTYSVAMKKKIKGFEESLKEMETRIQAAQEDMRDAFAELKKIEITQRRREKREFKDISDKESKTLDEMGLETYRRRMEEES
jgi:flagellar export protein FliJ